MSALPELPLDAWEPTKDTLHLWAQIVGKVRLGCVPPKKHWWHCPLYVDTRGLTSSESQASRLMLRFRAPNVPLRLPRQAVRELA